MTLDEIKPGQACEVVDTTVGGMLGQRLMDMGLYPGLTIRVVRNAPLKDPMEVQLDGSYVSLRHSEAKFVEVELR